MGRNWSLFFVGLGLLLIGLAVPLILGKVGPNTVYGFRTEKTLSSPEIWRAANHAAGVDLAIAGAAIALAAVVFYFVGSGWSATKLSIANLAVTTVAITAAVIHSVIVLNRL
jgi:uncharacterized membrane protein